MIFKFRVISDEIQTFLRVIEISETDTFESLHKCIQKACDFDDSQIASFNISNDEWEKFDEISLFDMGNEETPTMLMSETIIGDNVSHVDDTLIYTFDFFGDRALFLVLIEVKEAESIIKYPICSHSTGKAPELMPAIEEDIDSLLGEETFDDDYGDDLDPLSSGDYDELPEDYM